MCFMLLFLVFLILERNATKMMINVPQSKDMFCDFLIAHIWQKFLKDSAYDYSNDYDLLEDLNIVQKFYTYLGAKQLKQFNINSALDLQKFVKQVYHNLTNSGIDF